MMAEGSLNILMCDIHNDDVAQALCRFHKKLLCLSCVLEQAKSPECSITEIRKVSEEKDNALLDCLLVRQIAKKKEKLIDEHEKKTDSIKKELEQKVIEMHGNLTNRLDEMKEKCLKLIDVQAKNVIAGNGHYKQSLALFETDVNEYIEKLTARSVDDMSGILIKVNDAKKEILEKIPDKDTTPEGKFEPNPSLNAVVLHPKTLLGNASLIDQLRYDKIDDEYISAQERPQNVVYSGSDEVVYETKKEKNNFAENVTNSEKAISLGSPNEKQSRSLENKQMPDIAEKTKTVSPDGKTEKEGGGLLKRFFRKDKKKTDQLDIKEKTTSTNTKAEQRTNTNPRKKSLESEKDGAENIYQESTFYTSDYVKPKYLINKTVEASALEQQFPSACKFSKLVDLGEGYIAMLSDIHKSVVLVRTDGQVCGQKKSFKEGKLAITSTGNKEVAVLAESGLQVSKFKVTSTGLSTTASFIIHEEISGITGFDYDITSSTFVVSSIDKVIVLDKTGKKLKALHYGTTKATATKEVATTYDFKSNCLYFLNKDDNTLKCYSFEKSDALWKRRLSHLFTPRTMYLYIDKLCIACKEGIAIFSATTGAPVVKRDTKEFLDDCLGICVIDDVLVISSNSENLTKSTTLAYISL